jgi:subtilase family serine protease
MRATSIPVMNGWHRRTRQRPQGGRAVKVGAVSVVFAMILAALPTAAASAAAAPSFSLSTSSLSFTAVTGSTSTGLVTVTAKKSLVIQAPATSTDSHFQDTRGGTCWSRYESQGSAIPGKATCTIQVAFSSATVGTFSGTLRISECTAWHATSAGLACDSLGGSQSVSLMGTATGQADLTVQSISLLGPTGGFAFRYSVTVANSGTASANVRNVGVVGAYSTDSSLGGDTFACSTPLSTTNLVLNPGATRTVTIGCDTAPSATDAFLLVRVDPTNTVHESNETNNLGSKALPVADLVVDSIQIHGADTNASFNYTVTIANIGNSPFVFGDSSPAVLVAGHFSDVQSLTDTAKPACVGLFTDSAGLAAGATAEIEIACDTLPRPTDDYLLAVVDAANSVVEVNETNNVGSHILPSPDLTIDAIAIEGANASHAFNYTVTVGLTSTATTPFDLRSLGVAGRFSSDDVFSDDDNSACLTFVQGRTLVSSGGTLDVSVTCDSAPAVTDNFLLLQLDTTDLYGESNESNNSSVAVLPPVDLVAEAVSFAAPSQAYAHSWIVTIRNKGNKPADLSTAIVAAYYNATDTRDVSEIGACGTTMGGTLAGGAATTVTVGCSGGARPSDNYLIVIVDQDNDVAESNENNNQTAFALLPDLTITAVAVDPDGSEPFNYTVTVTNNTTTPVVVSGGVVVQGMYSSDVTLSNDDLAACGGIISSDLLILAGGASLEYPVGCGNPLPAGANYLIVKVDNSDWLAERDETNNIFVLPLRSDLIVDSVTVDGATTENTFTYTASIKNVGGAPLDPDAVESLIEIAAYFSADDALDVSDTPLFFCRTALPLDLVLDPGESTDVHGACNVTASWGVDHLVVQVDTENSLTEADETNNVTSQLTPAVDLTISSIVVDETQVSGQYGFSVTVHLDSTVPIQTRGVGIATYYSNDATLDLNDNPGCSADQTASNIVPQSGDYQTFHVSCTTLPGTNDSYLIVRVDYQNAIHESNEDNNLLSQTLTRIG